MYIGSIKIKKGVDMKTTTLLTRFNTYDDYFDECPDFCGIGLTADFIKRVNAFRKAIDTMKGDGLDPYSIREFDYTLTLIDIPFEAYHISNYENIVFGSNGDESDFKELEDPDNGEPSVIEDYFRVDCPIDAITLNVTSTGFYYNAIIKHTDIRCGSDTINWEYFDSITKAL